jgi:multidrug resistance efflux pump
LIFVIGLRFVTPYSTDGKVVQHTIQLIPRLPEPTLVTGVLVEPNVPVKKGQPLFQFDKRPYQYKVDGLKAELAAARQRVLELKADLDAASQNVAKAEGQRALARSSLAAATAGVAEAKARAKQGLAKSTLKIAQGVAKGDVNAISKLRLDQARQMLAETDAAVKVALAHEARARVAADQEAEAAIKVALANEDKARVAYEQEAVAVVKVAQARETKARLAYTSQIDGENTTVARIKADLAQAEYYLDNTTMVAPEDGYVINLQVRPGMVSGIVRLGAIASFVVDAGRYVLATYNQENLKYVKDGQEVEVALDLYPGQIFKGKVKSIWQGTGQGQYLPSGDLPKFNPPPEGAPQGRFAVQIVLEGDQSQFPIGTQGAVAIYTTTTGGFPALRRIGIRGRTWANFLYPLNI